jgi:hypothetical protein
MMGISLAAGENDSESEQLKQRSNRAWLEKDAATAE